MKSFLILFLAILCVKKIKSNSVSHTPEEKEQWENFKLKYSKSYEDNEEIRRFSVFLTNYRKINEHNKQKKSFTLKMNKLGDWTNDEYRAFLNKSSSRKNNFILSKREDIENAPTYGDENAVEVDWRTKGVVTPVKDQGRCGSCYAFSATGALEGQYALKYDKLKSFSEKQLVDCSRNDGNYGCDGGFVEYCYEYLKKTGVMLENDYVYWPFQDDCEFDSKKVAAKVSSYYNTASGNEEALTKAIAKVGPAAILIDARHDSFHFYGDGVYDEPNCGNTPYDMNHAVLAVGYGTTKDNKDYYIVKNSWGEDWGKDGYILMSRNKKNQCGVATDVVMPVLV